MGHASSIATGIAQVKQSRNVWIFDGDGAAIMHLGALTQVGNLGLKNIKHIIFNNEAHDSVGAQPTAAKSLNFGQIALGCGYAHAFSVSTKQDLQDLVPKIKDLEGPVFVEVKIKPGARKDLGRPATSPTENKVNFMNFLTR